MSLIGINSLYPYSLTGIQDITGTVNGSTIIASISVAGQTFYLSVSLPDTNGNVVFTLNIPNSSTSITGLLSATDWNTFNGKENVLTFTSPLTRVGNNISFNYAVNNTWTGTQTYTNDIFYTSGNYYYTGLPNAITTNSLYVDPITGQLSYGPSTNILPLNNVFTGTNTFNNLVRMNANFIVENVNSDFIAMSIFRDKTNYPGDTLVFNSSGTLTMTSTASVGWLIDRNGNPTFNKTTTKTFEIAGDGGGQPMVIFRDKNTYPDNIFYYDNQGKLGHSTTEHQWVILPEGDADFSTLRLRSRIGFVGNVFRATRDVTAPFDFIYFDNLGTFGYNNSWSIQPVGDGIIIIGKVSTQWLVVNNTNVRNTLKFTHFEPSPPTFSSWISAEFTYDGIDKPIIGNLGLVLGSGYGATFGGHNSALTAWAPVWINPFATTYIATLVVTGSFTPPSDRRLKGDISYLDAGKSINFIKRLKPCIYRRIEKDDNPYRNKDEEQPIRNLQHGFIADEIEEIAQTQAQKALVGRMSFAGYDDCKNLAVLNLIPEMVQGMKEMIDKIERLETENKQLLERLETENKQLLERLETENKQLLERLTAIEDKLFRNRNILKY